MRWCNVNAVQTADLQRASPKAGHLINNLQIEPAIEPAMVAAVGGVAR
jgi:hypothetical protein